MNKRYQLIKPFVSDKIYETQSLSRGAKKCYKEVKQACLPNVKTFTIRDIDTHENYEFKINNPYTPPKISGEIESLVPHNPHNSDDRIKNIVENIKILESRITLIENTIKSKLKDSENKCVLM